MVTRPAELSTCFDGRIHRHCAVPDGSNAAVANAVNEGAAYAVNAEVANAVVVGAASAMFAGVVYAVIEGVDDMSIWQFMAFDICQFGRFRPGFIVA